MPTQWKQFYKRNRFLKLYWFFFPCAREKFLKKFRMAQIEMETAKILESLFFKEIKMSKMITIKGKDVSEDTIVEALKKHCGFVDELPLAAGDIVRNINGLRILVENQGNDNLLTSYGLDGAWQAGADADGFHNCKYVKVGTLTDMLSKI